MVSKYASHALASIPFITCFISLTIIRYFPLSSSYYACIAFFPVLFSLGCVYRVSLWQSSNTFPQQSVSILFFLLLVSGCVLQGFIPPIFPICYLHFRLHCRAFLFLFSSRQFVTVILYYRSQLPTFLGHSSLLPLFPSVLIPLHLFLLHLFFL